MKRKFWNGIELQVPVTDPVLQGMLKRILIVLDKDRSRIRFLEERIRNLEMFSDGKIKIGVGTFKMLPIQKDDGEAEDDYITEDEQ